MENRKESQRTKQEESGPLLLNRLILCWNEILYNPEARCFNMILHVVTRTHTHMHTEALQFIRSLLIPPLDEICFNLQSAGGTVNITCMERRAEEQKSSVPARVRNQAG